jgi:hypothetical protein
MLENQLRQLKKPVARDETASREQAAHHKETVTFAAGDDAKPPIENRKEPEEHVMPESRNADFQQKGQKMPKKPVTTLDPEKLKEWEEWQEPKEWQESGE